MTPGGAADRTITVDIVVPTTGRASLSALLAGLTHTAEHRIIVVDDRSQGRRLRVPAEVDV